MKRLKITGMILLAVFTAQLSFAQKGQGKKLDELKSELNLSDEQTLELQKSQTAAQAKLKVIRADEKMSKEQKRSAVREIRKEQKATMDKVLTEEQKAKMKDARKEKMSEQKEKRKAQHAELKTLRAEFDSKISEEDKAEIKRIKEVLKANKGEGRKSADDRSAFRETHKEDFEKLKAISEKYEDEMKAFFKEKGMDKREGRKGQKKMEDSAEKMKSEKGQRKGQRGKNGRKGNRMGGFLLMDF